MRSTNPQETSPNPEPLWAKTLQPEAASVDDRSVTSWDEPKLSATHLYKFYGSLGGKLIIGMNKLGCRHAISEPKSLMMRTTTCPVLGRSINFCHQ